MNTFATIIVANKNRSAAKALIGDGFFDIEAKKGLRKYWISSGHFKTEEYEAMVASDLVFYVDTENKFVDVLADKSLTRVIIEE
jgi:flagellar hook protein FlgE